MQYFITSLLVVVAATTFSLAAPLEIMGNSTFEIKQVPASRAKKAVPIQMMETYSKYAGIGAVAPANIVSAAAGAVLSGTVAAFPEDFDKLYICPVIIGGQELHLDFDTGSADLWVFSTETPPNLSAGRQIYDGSISGKRLSGQTWAMGYGDNSGASGIVYADTVVVGSIAATSQAVEAATSVSQLFSTDHGFDGLLGLSFSSMNSVQPKQQSTFFDNIKETLAQRLFTADLKKGAVGSYAFGYLDSSKYTGSITYVPLEVPSTYWQLTVSAYIVSNLAFDGGSTMIDTGTTFLFLPTSLVDNYYAEVEGSYYDRNMAQYLFTCAATLPDLAVVIGGTTFTVPGPYMAFAPLVPGGPTCIGGIQYNVGLGFSILGDIFLKSVFAVFDQTQSLPRLGFAKKLLN